MNEPSVCVRNLTKSFGNRRVIDDLSFDVYRGDKIPEGKKQYALNFVLQDPEKTLTDVEVEKAMSRLLATYENSFGATLR